MFSARSLGGSDSRGERFHGVPIASLDNAAPVLLVSRVTSSAQVQFQAICGREPIGSEEARKISMLAATK